MNEDAAIWLDLLRENAEQLAKMIKNSALDRTERRDARALLLRAFQLEQGQDESDPHPCAAKLRSMVYELDKTLSRLIESTSEQSSMEAAVQNRYRHEAIKLHGGTKWKELVRWLEESEIMHERMLSRIDWLVERSERAAELMGGVRLAETREDQDPEPRETYELVKKPERKKRRR